MPSPCSSNSRRQRGNDDGLTKKAFAHAHIDALAKKYLGQDTYPFRRPTEARVIVKVVPEKIQSMG